MRFEGDAAPASEGHGRNHEPQVGAVGADGDVAGTVEVPALAVGFDEFAIESGSQKGFGPETLGASLLDEFVDERLRLDGFGARGLL